MNAVEMRGVIKSFGQVTVANGLDLTLQSGRHYALIGPNGAGKTTLFHLLSGHYVPDAGQIRLHGREVQGLPVQRIARMGLARSFQVSSLFMQMTAFDNVCCALMWRLGYRYAFWRLLSGSRDLKDRAMQLLAEIGLQGREHVLASALSYAEQRMLEVGMTLATGADIILLDEPTAGMSRAESERMASLIASACKDKTLVVIEHDMDVAFRLAEEIIVLAEGRVVAQGLPEEIRANRAVQQLYFEHGQVT